MKKYISLLLAFVISVSLLITASADAGGPNFPEIEGYVSNPDGAETYEINYYPDNYAEKSDVVIPYGTEVRIIMDTTADGVTFTEVSYNDRWYYVKPADISSKKAEFSPSDGYRLPCPRKAVVLCEEGIELRSGPSSTYKVTSKPVPAETVLEYQYIDIENGAWSYTTFNGQSGWFECGDYPTEKIGRVVDSGTPYSGYVKVLKDGVRLCKTPADADLEYMIENGYEEDLTKTPDYVTSHIPAGTEFTFIYYVSTPTRAACVEYNGVKGYLMLDEDIVEYGVNKVILANSDNVVIYKEHDITSGSFNQKIPVNTIISVDREFDTERSDGTFSDGSERIVMDSWYRVTYKGVTGWVLEDSENVYSGSSCFKRTAKNSIVLYSERSKASSVVGRIEAGGDCDELSFNLYDEELNWVCLNCNGKIGWALNPEFDYSKDPYYYESYDLSIFANYVEPEPETETVTQSEIHTFPESTTQKVTASGSASGADEQKTESLSSKSKIALCAAGAAVLCLTAAITIVLVNKKRKSC